MDELALLRRIARDAEELLTTPPESLRVPLALRLRSTLEDWHRLYPDPIHDQHLGAIGD